MEKASANKFILGTQALDAAKDNLARQRVAERLLKKAIAPSAVRVVHVSDDPDRALVSSRAALRGAAGDILERRDTA